MGPGQTNELLHQGHYCATARGVGAILHIAIFEIQDELKLSDYDRIIPDTDSLIEHFQKLIVNDTKFNVI